jgi:hypothetical protein
MRNARISSQQWPICRAHCAVKDALDEAVHRLQSRKTNSNSPQMSVVSLQKFEQTYRDQSSEMAKSDDHAYYTETSAPL